jgi:glycosyltransferase involved in cell wall biosynthesis
MRIAINTLSAAQGSNFGGARYIRSLVKTLAKVDSENDYLLYVAANDMERYSALGRNFQLLPTVAYRPLRLLWEQTGLPLDLKRRRVDVFHGPTFITPLAKTCRQVVTVHDMTFTLIPESHTFVRKHYFQFLIPKCVSRADAVLASSENTKKDIVRLLGISPERVTVIYLGKDDRFQPSKDQDAVGRVRAKYGLAGGVILCVGIIQPRKNLDSLIRAYSKLKPLQGNYQLVLAGGFGWGYDEVLRAAADCGLGDRVVFPGFIPDDELPILYSLADLSVYPSVYEGFGFPVLEAMGCGVPVITSNVSSMPEIAGDACVLVNPTNIDELAQAMERILSDRELRAGMAAKGVIRSQLFTWEKTALATLAAYEQAVRQ